MPPSRGDHEDHLHHEAAGEAAREVSQQCAQQVKQLGRRLRLPEGWDAYGHWPTMQEMVEELCDEDDHDE